MKNRKLRTGQWTIEDVRGLPAVVSLDDAASVLDIGRTKAHQLAREGCFPVPVLKVGCVYKVPTAGLLAVLGLSPDMNGAPPASGAPVITDTSARTPDGQHGTTLRAI